MSCDSRIKAYTNYTETTLFTLHTSPHCLQSTKPTIHMHKTPRDKVSWHQNLARDNVVCNFLGMDLMDLMDHEWFAFLKPPWKKGGCLCPFDSLRTCLHFTILYLNSIWLEQKKSMKICGESPRNQSTSPTKLCKSPEIAVPLKSSSLSSMRAKLCRFPEILVSANSNLSFLGCKHRNKSSASLRGTTLTLWDRHSHMGSLSRLRMDDGYSEAVHWTSWRLDFSILQAGYRYLHYLRFWRQNS